MAALGFTAGAATNNRTAAITSVVADILTPYTETMTSSQIYDGKFRQKPNARKKSIGSERVHGFTATAEWKYMLANGTNIPLLVGLSNAASYVNVNFVNGDNAVFGNSTVGDNGVIKWKLVVDGDGDKDRYVQMQVQRSGLYTGGSAYYDSDDLWGSFTPGVNSPLFTGTTYPPSGIKTFEIRATDTWETLGNIRNTKFSAEMMCDVDSQLRYVPRNIHIEYAIEVMDFTATSLSVLDSFHDLASVDTRFTLMEGAIFTGADILGGMAEVVVEGDSDKDAFMLFTGSGDIQSSAFAALWS